MARRTISVGLLHDVLQCVERNSDSTPPILFNPDKREYVTHVIDGGPFERLLWREIKHIEKKARMTEWQQWVFECHLRGLSIAETATVCDRAKSTIQHHLDAAFEKALGVKYRGMLTVMIETMGWPAVREALADKLELKLARRR